MAPKLTPDNLTLPEQYMLDLDRNLLDHSIFPLPHHAGELAITPNSFSKKYTPAPPLPSPYNDGRFITDVRVASQLEGFTKSIKYTAVQAGAEICEEKHYFGQGEKNRLALESVMNGTRALIAEIGKTRDENRYPGGDVEIITLGTGSAIPNKLRNGMTSIVSC
jgi:hypothetical protein